jgi:hypothetical protein
MKPLRPLSVVALSLSVSCGSSDGTPDGGSIMGNWRLVAQTIGGTVSPEATLNGSLQLGATEAALATESPLGGTVTTYTVTGDGKALSLADGTRVPFTLVPGADQRITLDLGGARSVTFAPAGTPVEAHELSVTGTVTKADGAADLVAPRAALIFAVRYDPQFWDDPRDDKPLTFTGKTATFDLSRTSDPLGTERITFAPDLHTGIAIAFVVVYDDRDKDGKLSDLYQPCGPSTKDCIVGVAATLVTFRDGGSPELAASPYAYMNLGWTESIPVTDHRSTPPKTGLVSGDAMRTPTFDVALAADPSTVTVPRLDLTMPQVKRR